MLITLYYNQIVNLLESSFYYTDIKILNRLSSNDLDKGLRGGSGDLSGEARDPKTR